MSETYEFSPEELEAIEAENEKMRAEAERFRAQAEEARANAAAAKAETRKMIAEAKKAELDLERDQEKRSRELASNDKHHLYVFDSAVGENSVKACITQLLTWNRLEPECAIEIEFCSPGGGVISGMALFDKIQQLRALGHYITTSTIGFAASMGGILLQAGDHRVMGREAYILIHEVQAAALGTMGEIEDEVEFLKKIQSRILDIFAHRSKLTKVQLARRWKRRNWWIDSTEALKLGLVDEVR